MLTRRALGMDIIKPADPGRPAKLPRDETPIRQALENMEIDGIATLRHVALEVTRARPLPVGATIG